MKSTAVNIVKINPSKNPANSKDVNKRVRIISSRNKPLLSTLASVIRDIFTCKTLASRIAKRDISAQYRKSFLGIFWTLVSPITTAFLWIVLSKSNLVEIGNKADNYEVYVFSGTIFWSIIMDAINMPLLQFNGNKQLLAKLNFKREALVVSGILIVLFNASIKVTVLLLALSTKGIGITFYTLGLIPSLIGLIIFGTLVGVLLIPIGLLYNDVAQSIPIWTQLWMYASPIVFDPTKSPLLREFSLVNPVFYLVSSSREAVQGLPLSDSESLLSLIAISVVLFLFAMVLLKIAIPIAIERMSS